MIELPPNVQMVRNKRGVIFRWVPPHRFRGEMKSVTLGYNLDKAIKQGESLNRICAKKRGCAKELAGFYAYGTFAHLCYEYLSSRQFLCLAASTQDSFRSYIKNLLKFEYKGEPLSDFYLPLLTSKEADKIILAMEDYYGYPAIHGYYAVLRRLFYVGIRLDLVDRNPFARMGLKVPLPRGVFWTPDDIQQILVYCEEENDKVFSLYFRLLYETAQRPCDICTLRMEDFDYSRSPVTVEFNQKKTGAYLEVPISDALSADVLDWCQPSGYLFSANRDRRYVQNWFKIHFDKLKSKLGLNDDLQLRDLRRTAALEAAEKGATDRELIALTGHSTPKMLNVYAPRNLQQAASAQMKRGLIDGHASKNH